MSGADASINIILEMKYDSGQIKYTGDNDIYLKISNNKINTLDPVWVKSGGIEFPGTVDYKVIDIHIANSVNNDVFGPVRNITIV